MDRTSYQYYFWRYDAEIVLSPLLSDNGVRSPAVSAIVKRFCNDLGLEFRDFKFPLAIAGRKLTIFPSGDVGLNFAPATIRPGAKGFASVMIEENVVCVTLAVSEVIDAHHKQSDNKCFAFPQAQGEDPAFLGAFRCDVFGEGPLRICKECCANALEGDGKLIEEVVQIDSTNRAFILSREVNNDQISVCFEPPDAEAHSGALVNEVIPGCARQLVLIRLLALAGNSGQFKQTLEALADGVSTPIRRLSTIDQVEGQLLKLSQSYLDFSNANGRFQEAVESAQTSNVNLQNILSTVVSSRTGWFGQAVDAGNLIVHELSSERRHYSIKERQAEVALQCLQGQADILRVRLEAKWNRRMQVIGGIVAMLGTLFSLGQLIDNDLIRQLASKVFEVLGADASGATLSASQIALFRGAVLIIVALLVSPVIVGLAQWFYADDDEVAGRRIRGPRA